MSEHVQISGILPRKRYISNGTDNVFEFPFAFFDEKNIKVYIGSVLQDASAYTVSDVKENNGGKVIFEKAPTQGEVITIVRDLVIERTSDFPIGGEFNANTLNDELDYQTACIQQVADSINRTMVLPAYVAGDGVNLSLPTPDAGKAIIWNEDGTNLKNSILNVDDYNQKLTEVIEAEQNVSEMSSRAVEAELKSKEYSDIALQSMTDKMDKDLSNIPLSTRVMMTNYAFPSDEYVDISLSRVVNMSYTAPANGFISVFGTTTSTTQSVIEIQNYGTEGEEMIGFYRVDCHTNSQILGGTLPCKAGDHLNLYTSCGKNTSARFVFAVGELE